MNFLHYYNPEPIIFSIGSLPIRWYGLLIAIALLLCLMVVLRLFKNKGMDEDKIYDLALWLAVGGIIGARLYEVLFINFDYYAFNLISIFKVWEGGLAIHGGIIGGVIALFAWVKINKEDFWRLADLVAVVLPLGQAIGRWGNYFNGELYGGPTDSFIGIPISISNRLAGFDNYSYFHPTFLYESIMNFILFLILLTTFKKTNPRKGIVSMYYLIGYSVIRFTTEFIRIDPTPVYFGLRLPQVVSILIFAFAIGFILIRRKTDTKTY
jgi:phosphatidylglycerol:prolipoprotein diacylglycerol transferase